MSYRHKNFDQSETMREFEKLLQKNAIFGFFEEKKQEEPITFSPAKEVLEQMAREEEKNTPIFSPGTVETLSNITNGIDAVFRLAAISPNPLISSFGAGYSFTIDMLNGNYGSAVLDVIFCVPGSKLLGATIKDLALLKNASFIGRAFKINPEKSLQAAEIILKEGKFSNIKSFYNSLRIETTIGQQINFNQFLNLQRATMQLKTYLQSLKTSPVRTAVGSAVKTAHLTYLAKGVYNKAYGDKKEQEDLYKSKMRQLQKQEEIINSCLAQYDNMSDECVLTLKGIEETNNKFYRDVSAKFWSTQPKVNPPQFKAPIFQGDFRTEEEKLRPIN